MIIPWTTFRKVPVKSEVLSPVVILLRFKDGCRTGLFGRISRHPLTENHAFGIASPSPTSEEHYMCIVGRGDFTRNLITNRPTYLWIRQFKFVWSAYYDILLSVRRVRRYRHSHRCRSVNFPPTRSKEQLALALDMRVSEPSRVFYSFVIHDHFTSSNIESTYGSTVLKDLKKSFDEQDDSAFEGTVTLWDTKLKGRPNMAELISGLVERQKAKVVFCDKQSEGHSGNHSHM